MGTNIISMNHQRGVVPTNNEEHQCLMTKGRCIGDFLQWARLIEVDPPCSRGERVAEEAGMDNTGLPGERVAEEAGMDNTGLPVDSYRKRRLPLSCLLRMKKTAPGLP